MPLYTIEHVCPLTAAQHDDLAEAITHIHTDLFATPRLFVQVRFTDMRPAAGAGPVYIGGRRRPGNHISAHVRTGPSRTQADYAALVERLVAAWARIVPLPVAKFKRDTSAAAAEGDGGEAPPTTELRTCVVLGGIVAGWEAGFALPPAGGDAAWLAEHWDEFEAKAAAGDADFVDLLADVRARGLLPAGAQSARQRLEEMLGWGDSA